MDWELIFAVDPCTDRTEELILALRELRPAGQDAALLAALRPAGGDARRAGGGHRRRGGRDRLRPAGPARGDRRDVARWREGYDVVYAQRRTREGETLPKRIVAALGYRVIKRIAEVEIPANTGDFRLMSRRVVDHVVALDEAHGFLRGLVALVGFRRRRSLYDRDPRAAGSEQVQPLHRARW